MAVSASARHGYAWIALALSFACHVLDEAATGFLSVYNPAVLHMRAVLPWLPVPAFTFAGWTLGLTTVVIALLCLSWFAFLGRRWMVTASYPYAVFMAANGLAHIVGSVYVREMLPGVISSPLLIAASIYLWRTARRTLTSSARPASA